MKRILTLILVVVMVFGLVACAKPDVSEDTSEETTATESETSEETAETIAQELAVCVGSEPGTLDPNMNETVDGMIYISHMYEGLYRPNSDGTFSLGQAEDVQITENADGTFHVVATLRDDIVWSDGVPVTANDFEFSWKRLCDPANGYSYGYIGQDFFANGADVRDEVITPDELCVTAVDDKTLEFDILANVPYVKDLLAFPSLMPIRQDIVEANPDSWSVEAETQVSNGRYTLTEFAHESQIVLTKSETYWDTDSTNVTQVTCMLSDDDNAILAAFNAGDLDLVDTFPADELAALRETPEYTQYGQIGLYYIQIQQMEGAVEALLNPDVRKALSLAIDREYINQTVWADSRIPAYSLVPYGVPDAGGPGTDFRETAGEVVGGDFSTDYATDLEKAKELLAAAGYPDGEGIPTLEYVINENTGHQAVAEAVKTMWEEIGVEMEIVVMDWATLVDYRKTSDCETARQGWIGDYTDPATFFDLFTSNAGTNDGHYNNAQYDELVIGARSEADPVTRMEMYHQAEEIIMSEMGIIPIVFYADDVLTHTNVTGVGVTGTGLKMFWDAVVAAE